MVYLGESNKPLRAAKTQEETLNWNLESRRFANAADGDIADNYLTTTSQQINYDDTAQKQHAVETSALPAQQQVPITTQSQQPIMSELSYTTYNPQMPMAVFNGGSVQPSNSDPNLTGILATGSMPLNPMNSILNMYSQTTQNMVNDVVGIFGSSGLAVNGGVQAALGTTQPSTAPIPSITASYGSSSGGGLPGYNQS
jgi:hypothetical protein